MTDQPVLFDSWLAETKKLQEEYYGADFERFKDNNNLIEYIKMNFIATICEMVELIDETTWKPWAKDEPDVARALVKKEAIDALHFIANILVGCGYTDEEVTASYLGKMELNRQRQRTEGGYRIRDAGVKCRVCRRALDDDLKPSAADPGVCEICIITFTPAGTDG